MSRGITSSRALGCRSARGIMGAQRKNNELFYREEAPFPDNSQGYGTARQADKGKKVV